MSDPVLWKARMNSPWRDLPEEFGDWNTVFKRFDDWPERGVFEEIFEAISDDPDMEYAMIDATIVPVHRHALPWRTIAKRRRVGTQR